MKKKRNKNKKLMRETEATRETMRENKNESRNKDKMSQTLLICYRFKFKSLSVKGILRYLKCS